MADELWVARLNPSDAAAVWPKALPCLAPAIARCHGLFLAEDVEQLVTAPDAGTPLGWSLWIVAEKDQILGAWTTKVQRYPRRNMLEIVFGGGTQMRRWYALAVRETEKFAAEAGCDRLTCAGRRGWERFGYRRIGFLHIFHLFERKLAS